MSGTSPTARDAEAHSASQVVLRPPRLEDAPALWQLVIDTGNLDRNSSYTYALVCRDFAETSIVVEEDGEIVGCITGYRPPGDPDVIFVWQVAVAERARGRGLSSRMLDGLVESPGCRGVRYMETTVTASNEASRAMFGSFARRRSADLVELEGFPASLFPEEGHEAEPRLRIGPFDAGKSG